MIPRIVHRVWLGPHQPPAEHDYAQAWAKTHPGWSLVTWTDDLVAGLDLVLPAHYAGAPTYVHRADLILMEVVWAFGGMAVGYDSEPLRNVEPLIADYDAWCTEDADGWPGQAFFGATRHHAAIGALLRDMHERVNPRSPAPWPAPHIATGPYLFRDVFGEVRHDPRHGEWPMTLRHGMTCIAGVDAAYPVHYTDRDLLTNPARSDELARAKRRTYVLHHFAHSWRDLADVAVVST